jgi:L-lactate dehydrogenase complex protein LldG
LVGATVNARAEILTRIRTALGDRPAPAPVVRDYRPARGVGDVDLFVDRVTDYQATVHRAAGDVSAVITRVLVGRGIARIIVPDGYPAEWLPGVEQVGEPADVSTLDSVGAVLTTCRIAIAETGTIVLDAGAGQGPRALTLVTDYHLVVISAEQVLASVPDAVAVLDPIRPLTWISGPSATSDIELNRVEGVHGPRTLDVVVVD